MSIPVYQTTQCYIPQDCKLNVSGWEQSGLENILTERVDVQNCIIKSFVTSALNQLPPLPEYTMTLHIKRPLKQSWNFRKIILCMINADERMGWWWWWWWGASTNYWVWKPGRRPGAQIHCICFCLFQWYYSLITHINPSRPSPILYILAKSIHIKCEGAPWDSSAVSTTMEVTWDVM